MQTGHSVLKAVRTCTTNTNNNTCTCTCLGVSRPAHSPTTYRTVSRNDYRRPVVVERNVTRSLEHPV